MTKNFNETLPGVTLNNVRSHGLNPLAFLKTPPRDVSIRDEAKQIATSLQNRMCPVEEAEQAIVNLVGREVQKILEAFRKGDVHIEEVEVPVPALGSAKGWGES